MANEDRTVEEGEGKRKKGGGGEGATRETRETLFPRFLASTRHERERRKKREKEELALTVGDLRTSVGGASARRRGKGREGKGRREASSPSLPA